MGSENLTEFVAGEPDQMAFKSPFQLKRFYDSMKYSSQLLQTRCLLTMLVSTVRHLSTWMLFPVLRAPTRLAPRAAEGELVKNTLTCPALQPCEGRPGEEVVYSP